VDGLLAFWVLSAIFAVIGTAIKGLIRPISWTTLGIATLLMAPGRISETVNAVRDGEVRLSLPSLPPPPTNAPTASPTLSPTLSPAPAATDPVQLDPNAAPASPASPLAPIADKGWNRAGDAGLGVLPPGDQTASASPSPAAADTASRPADPAPPVTGLW
jgi:hypothetical protein